MRRLLIAAAALVVAACDTTPYPNDPYGYPEPYPGEPYPPPAPYPGDPYPPAPYPGTPYPPSYPQAPMAPAGACDGIESREWRAWVDRGPGGDDRPTLFLSGAVVAPTAGYRMEFRPYLEERRSYPVQVVATLQPFPPDDPAAQVRTTHDLRWQWPLASGPVGSVTIRCGERTLAEVPVGTAP